MKRAAFLVLAVAASGCAIPLSSQNEAFQHNTCTRDADCGDGAVCVGPSDAKACIATHVDLAGLKLVVTPAAGSSSVTSTPTILDPAAHMALTRDANNGFAETFDATVPALVALEFVTTYPCDPMNADASFKVPSAMTLTSNPVAPGLPVSTFFAKSDPLHAGLQSVAVPPGLYSAYIQPGTTTDCPTAPPPALVGLCLQADCPPGYLRPSAKTTLDLGGDIALEGSITSSFSLNGWTLDLVDLVGGRLLSDQLVLHSPGGVATQIQFQDLHFNWPDKDLPPIIRLTPPADSPAPSVYWDLASVLGPSGSPTVKLTLGEYPGPDAAVTTEVLVLDNQSKVQQGYAQVTFESSAIEGIDTFATFRMAVQANGDGVATARLPPGRYTVRATPSIGGHAFSIGDTTLTIPQMQGTSGGHALTLPLKAQLVGGASTPQGEALVGVTVTAVASTAPELPTFEDELTLVDPLQPRAVSTTTDDHGGFTLPVDVGAPLDVSVRPLAESGFPWLVSPQLYVQDGGGGDDPLKGLVLTAPAVLKGRLSDPSGASVPNADVAAYLPITLSGMGTVFVQVGDTRTDANGDYVLVLPSSIPQ